MTKEQRIDFQYWTALFMLIAGVVLAFIGFFCPPMGEISNGVLYFTAQCLIYAGSIFGVGIYVQNRINDVKRELGQEMRHLRDGVIGGETDES